MERLTQRRETPLVMSMWGGDSESLRIYNRLAEYENTEAEREKGCEYCNEQKKLEFESGYYGYMGERKPYVEILDDVEPSMYFVRSGNSTYFSINFCPNCGRKLEGKC